jgi:hypothetical protein
MKNSDSVRKLGSMMWIMSSWTWGTDVNVLPKQTWEMMGKPKLVWSLVQLRLMNQHKIVSIGQFDRSTCEHRWGAQCGRL